MATGGIFKLVANDGKADRLIMATQMLNQRMSEIVHTRMRLGKKDLSPPLTEIEKTHILYVNAHFMPFAAIGYEYSKTKPQSGNVTLGGSITFSIPQFGDFFNDMVCRVRLGKCMGLSGMTPSRGGVAFPHDDPPLVGNANGSVKYYNIVDVVGNMLVQGNTATSVNASGATVANPDAPISYRNFVRYCEYPGNRLFKQVKFEVNGNPLDSYSMMVPVMMEKFCTPPHKRTGHDRLVGQESPRIGYGGLNVSSVVDSDLVKTPRGLITSESADQSNQTVGLFAQAGQTIVNQTDIAKLGSLTGDKQYDVSRKIITVVNGHQTPKPVQPPLEVWNKLRFWFNEDVKLSIASVAIPFGQRFVSIDLSEQKDLVYEFPSIYLETIEESTTNSVMVRKKTYSPIHQLFGMTQIPVENVELYINNIFVNNEIHDIYIKRIGFSLVRVYREQQQRSNQNQGDEHLLASLKWPVEYMYVGLRPSWNTENVMTGTGGVVTSGNPNQWRDWHRMTKMVTSVIDKNDKSEHPSDNRTATISSSISKVIPDEYYLPVPTINSLTLLCHGIKLYDEFSDKFYNQYVPYHYGGTEVTTPDDCGAFMINMSLFPRKYQPSGHLNFSRARESYIKWTTTYVSSATNALLIVVASCLNFLLISDGSAVLRFST